MEENILLSSQEGEYSFYFRHQIYNFEAILMAVVPRGVILGMLFYLTFAVAGTIWISMKYLSEKDCDCGQYFERVKLSTSQHEHDFPHTKNEDRITSKLKRAEATSLQESEQGIVY